jgi:hypothetical protein
MKERYLKFNTSTMTLREALDLIKDVAADHVVNV